MTTADTLTSQLLLLVRGKAETLTPLLAPDKTRENLVPLVIAIIFGCSLYGFAIGLWRAPLQGLYVAVKMPFLIFLTLTVNGLINGILGVLLGSGMSFRQTLLSCVMSFATFSLIVGSLSPLAIALVLDAPKPGEPGTEAWYRSILLTHTFIIAFAGIVANHKLLTLIQAFSGSAAAGWRTLLAWLAGNLFVGAQLSYNLRPFFGNPDLPVQFLRPNPFDGNFYEAVTKMVLASLSGHTLMVWVSLFFVIGIAVAFTRQIISQAKSPE